MEQAHRFWDEVALKRDVDLGIGAQQIAGTPRFFLQPREAAGAAWGGDGGAAFVC